MCCEDYRIGRRIVVQSRTVAVGVALTTLAARNHNRVWIGFSYAPGSGVAYVRHEADAAVGLGHKLDGFAPYLEFHLARHGRIAQDKFTAIGSVAAVAVTVYEGIAEHGLCEGKTP